MSTYGRRGNSALQALQGSRAVPSLKRKFGSSFTLPSKKKAFGYFVYALKGHLLILSLVELFPLIYT